MTVDPLTPAPGTPRHAPVGPDLSWAYDLVETPPAELRKRRLRRIAAGVGAALVVLAVVAGIAVHLRDSGSDVVVDDSIPPHDAVLTSYLIPAPAGALPPPSLPAGRDLDLAAAAEVTGDRRSLRRYKFSYGYERRWSQEDGALVTVWLLRFRGAKNAAYYVRDSFEVGAADHARQVRPVAGVPGGRSLVDPAPGDGRHAAISAAAAGDVAVFVIVAADRETAPMELAERLLADSYERL